MFGTLITGMIGGILGCVVVCNTVIPHMPSSANASQLEMEGCVNRSTRSYSGETSTVLDCN